MALTLWAGAENYDLGPACELTFHVFGNEKVIDLFRDKPLVAVLEEAKVILPNVNSNAALGHVYISAVRRTQLINAIDAFNSEAASKGLFAESLEFFCGNAWERTYSVLAQRANRIKRIGFNLPFNHVPSNLRSSCAQITKDFVDKFGQRKLSFIHTTRRIGGSISLADLPILDKTKWIGLVRTHHVPFGPDEDPRRTTPAVVVLGDEGEKDANLKGNEGRDKQEDSRTLAVTDSYGSSNNQKCYDANGRCGPKPDGCTVNVHCEYVVMGDPDSGVTANSDPCTDCWQ